VSSFLTAHQHILGYSVPSEAEEAAAEQRFLVANNPLSIDALRLKIAAPVLGGNFSDI